MAPQAALHEFFRYVQNDIPFRLIFIPEMKLVDRFFVQKYYLPQIAIITQEKLNQSLQEWGD